MSNKYSQKSLDSARKSITDAIKTASKRLIQKTAETIGDLIGNKTADKITSISKELHPKSPKELHSVVLRSKEIHSTKKIIKKYQKKDIYLSRKKTRNY